MLRLECVTVCLEYDDYLENTVRVNQSLFDDWIIVTSLHDKGTVAVCERYGLRWVHCPYFSSGDSKFDKARAINLGLAHLTCKDWVLHLDADIALPRNTRKHLDNISLDPLNLYTFDRVDCPSYEAWVDHLVNPDLSEKHYFGRGPKDWKRGTRLLHFDYGGFAPIGYAQLFNRASGITRYPTVQDGSAEHTDVLFSLQWERARRVLVPEVVAVHLTQGPAPMGVNWHGRKTGRFGPSQGQRVNFRMPAESPAGVTAGPKMMLTPTPVAAHHHPHHEPEHHHHHHEHGHGHHHHPHPHPHPVPPPQPPPYVRH